MLAMDFWPKFVLATLAAWRLTHLLVREDGPAQLLVRLRLVMGQGLWGQMFDCFYCMSLWVAAPISMWFAESVAETVLACLAISGAACLFERSGQPQVVTHSTPTSTPEMTENTSTEGASNELLRTTP